MVNLKEIMANKTVIGLVLGQILSLLITSTGFSSSELARRGINAPTSQSLANYVLLAIVYGGILIHRGSGLKARWYYYLLLGVVDVEANYLVVKAYQYTSITSIMLLDCWAIPSVIVLTWLFLKTRYRFQKIAGVAICVAGLVLVIFSDVHAADRSQSGSSPIKGDFLVLAGATLYAVSNVSEEFFVKTADRIELMAMLGLFGAIISGIQIAVLEREELRSIHWSSGSLLPYTGFAAAMFLFYSGVPVLLKSVSAFSPIVNPINCPWGQKAFTNYLGDDKTAWEEYDATCLIAKYNDVAATILIDQGDDDKFLHENQLLPSKFDEACRAAKAPLLLRMQPGYDHSYFFIASFIDDHIRHHAQALNP